MNMKIRLGIISLLLSAHGFLFLESAYADGSTTQCIVTVKSVKLKNLAGDWLVLDDTSHSVDLATENIVLSTANKGKLPSGIYKNFKITISEAIQFAGFDGRNQTKAGGEITYGGTASKTFNLPGDLLSLTEQAPSWNKEQEGLVKMHLNLDYQDRDEIIEIYSKKDFSRDLQIKDDSKVEIGMVVELKDQIKFTWPNSLAPGVPAKEVMILAPPKITEVSVNIDEAVVLTVANQLETEF